jgi:hypothetical protein
MSKQPWELYKEDQRDRRRVFGVDGTKSASEEAIHDLEVRDAKRQSDLNRFLKKHQLKTGKDFYAAAMLLQHGNISKDYLRAHQFAQKASKLNYKPALWLEAATYDRYLKSLGRKQKFGTQFYLTRKGIWKIWPYSMKTTDVDRKHYGVESLKDLKTYEKRLNQKTT